MWLHTCLEEVQALGTVRVVGYFLTTGIVYLGHLTNKGHHVAKKLHQAAHPHVLASTYTEYGEDRAGNQALADAFAQFVLGKGFFLEELLHQGLIVLGSSFNQCLMQFHGLIHLLSRNVLDNGGSAFWFPAIFLHQKHVDKCIETRTGSYRVLYLYTLASVNLGHGIDNIIKIALV